MKRIELNEISKEIWRFLLTKWDHNCNQISFKHSDYSNRLGVTPIKIVEPVKTKSSNISHNMQNTWPTERGIFYILAVTPTPSLHILESGSFLQESRSSSKKLDTHAPYRSKPFTLIRKYKRAGSQWFWLLLPGSFSHGNVCKKL